MSRRFVGVCAALLSAGGAAFATSLSVRFDDSVLDATAILTTVTLYAVGGAVILVARPGHRLGPLLLAASLAWGLGEGALAYAVHSDPAASGSAAGAAVVGVLGTTLRGVGWLLLVAGVPLWFPDGRSPFPGLRWPVRLLVAAIGTFAAGTLLSPQPLDRRLSHVSNPFGVPDRWSAVPSLLALAGLGLTAASLVVAVVGLYRRWRTADDRARGALRWFAVAFACPLVLLPLVATPWARGWMFAMVTIPVLVVVVVVALQRRFEDAREGVVRAREEERRRLRRDLHDGLGPALAALTLRVDALRNRSADPALDLDAELVNLRDGIQDVIVDVRRVIEGLRPPALDEVGVAMALEQLAASFESADGLEVEVEVVTLPSLPAAVESALYRVAQEALTNVARHARASRARLTVTVRREQVCLEVVDDGTGRVAHTSGVGLTSMRERVEEISGSFRVAGRPGLGTTVLALFPLETPRGERT